MTLKEIYNDIGPEGILKKVKETLQGWLDVQEQYFESDEYLTDSYVEDEDKPLVEIINRKRYWDDNILNLIRKLQEIGVEEDDIKEALQQATEPVVNRGNFIIDNTYSSIFLGEEEEAYEEVSEIFVKFEGQEFSLVEVFSLLFDTEPNTNWVNELKDYLDNWSYSKLQKKEMPTEIRPTIYLGERSVAHIVDYNQFYREAKSMIRSWKQAKKFMDPKMMKGLEKQLQKEKIQTSFKVIHSLRTQRLQASVQTIDNQNEYISSRLASILQRLDKVKHLGDYTDRGNIWNTKVVSKHQKQNLKPLKEPWQMPSQKSTKATISSTMGKRNTVNSSLNSYLVSSLKDPENLLPSLDLNEDHLIGFLNSNKFTTLHSFEPLIGDSTQYENIKINFTEATLSSFSKLNSKNKTRSVMRKSLLEKILAGEGCDMSDKSHMDWMSKQAEAGTEEVKLNSTQISDCYYVSFDKLPKEAQQKLEEAKVEVENSKYTVYEDHAFLRAEVEVNGSLWDAEISLGSVDIKDSDYQWDEENDYYVDDKGREVDSDAYAEWMAEELLGVIELRGTDVYLTFIKDLDSTESSVTSNFFEEEALKNDYNGKVAKLKGSLPTVFKAIMNSDMADRFQGGINGVLKYKTPDGKEFIFIETPGHGFYFDMKGICIGEEDGGLEGEWAQYNDTIQELDKKAVVIAGNGLAARRKVTAWNYVAVEVYNGHSIEVYRLPASGYAALIDGLDWEEDTSSPSIKGVITKVKEIIDAKEAD